ncbi:hypothetical protein [Bdellovibrio sp. HCB-162]|uniref:hypothetical protein n=1 Tax=Bdellovibrio sp. HCB-162 TaxID=3394234 RepID=UPI0039BD0DC7
MINNYIFFIFLGAVSGAVSLVSASYGFTLLAQKLAEEKENDISIVDASFDLVFHFDKSNFSRVNKNGLHQGRALITFNIREHNSETVVGRFTIHGSWQQEAAGFIDGGENKTAFSSTDQILQMVRMKPDIEFINNKARYLKSGKKYHFDILGLPNPPTFLLTPSKVVIRTKFGETHLAESFEGPFNSNWYSFTLVVP